MRLDQLPSNRPAAIAAIAWDSVGPDIARRLREFGMDEGVGVEVLHRGPIGRDPIACRIGRMTVALRARDAAAVTVTSSGGRGGGAA